MDSAAFQEHQRPGGRAKRLRSSGHSCLLFRPAPCVAAAGQWINVENANLGIPFASQQSDSKKARELFCPFQANQITLAAIKDVDVMNWSHEPQQEFGGVER